MSQKYTARVLRARAEALGCAVHTGWEFGGLEQSAGDVEATVAPTGVPEPVADGPRPLPRRRRRRPQRRARRRRDRDVGRRRPRQARPRGDRRPAAARGPLGQPGLLLRALQPAGRRPRAALGRRRVQPPPRRLRAGRRGQRRRARGEGADRDRPRRRGRGQALLAVPDPRADRRDLPAAAAC